MLFMERNELCWCGSGKKYKKCHMPIEEKILLHSERGEIVPTRAILKTAEQIEKIKESARLNTAVLDEVAKHIRIGMSTAETTSYIRSRKNTGESPRRLIIRDFRKVSALRSTTKYATVSRIKISFFRTAI